MDEEISLIYEELFLSGSCIIGKRRKDGRWDAKTYRILNGLCEIAKRYGRVVKFNKIDGSAELDYELFEVDINGKRIVAYKAINGHDLLPGDLYIAKRNTGWHLAKCLYVDKSGGWVMPDPPASIYSYDCHECFKVKEVTSI